MSAGSDGTIWNGTSQSFPQAPVIPANTGHSRESGNPVRAAPLRRFAKGIPLSRVGGEFQRPALKMKPTPAPHRGRFNERCRLCSFAIPNVIPDGGEAAPAISDEERERIFRERGVRLTFYLHFERRSGDPHQACSTDFMFFEVCGASNEQA